MENKVPEIDIYYACKTGKIDRVVNLIDLENIPINQPDEYNRTRRSNVK
jgi:hypothetical protein